MNTDHLQRAVVVMACVVLALCIALFNSTCEFMP